MQVWYIVLQVSRGFKTSFITPGKSAFIAMLQVCRPLAGFNLPHCPARVCEAHQDFLNSPIWRPAPHLVLSAYAFCR